MKLWIRWSGGTYSWFGQSLIATLKLAWDRASWSRSKTWLWSTRSVSIRPLVSVTTSRSRAASSTCSILWVMTRFRIGSSIQTPCTSKITSWCKSMRLLFCLPSTRILREETRLLSTWHSKTTSWRSKRPINKIGTEWMSSTGYLSNRTCPYSRLAELLVYSMSLWGLLSYKVKKVLLWTCWRRSLLESRAAHMSRDWLMQGLWSWDMRNLWQLSAIWVQPMTSTASKSWFKSTRCGVTGSSSARLSNRLRRALTRKALTRSWISTSIWQTATNSTISVWF